MAAEAGEQATHGYAPNNGNAGIRLYGFSMRSLALFLEKQDSLLCCRQNGGRWKKKSKKRDGAELVGERNGHKLEKDGWKRRGGKMIIKRWKWLEGENREDGE